MTTFAVTFDYWPEALTGGLPIMRARGLPATFFVATESGSVDLIDNPNYPSMPTSLQLADAQQAGWEIGIYSNTSMVTMLGTLSGTPPMATPTNALNTKRFMKAQKDKLAAKGFIAKSYAPNGRAWNAQLANLSRDLFEGVRVCADPSGFEPYPIVDPNYVNKKSFASLGMNDTVASLQQVIDDAMAAGNVLCTFVVHKVGPATNDPYMIPTPVFTGLCDALVTARNNGARVCTFAQAMKPA